MSASIFGLLPWAGVGLCAAALDGPEPRAYSAMAYDAARGVCVLYGGAADCLDPHPALYSDTWEWDGRFWRRRQPLTNPHRALTPAMVFDSRRGVCVLETNGSATWEYAAGQWRLASTQSLAMPSFYVTAYDSRRGVTVLHGGFVVVPNPPGTWTWEWDGSTWRLLDEDGGPSGWWNGMAFDEARGVTVNVDENETWAWDGASWTLLTTGGPADFHAYVACYDSVRSVIVVLASRGIYTQPCSTPTVSETWEWDGAVWTRRDVPGPSPRFGPALAYDRRRGVSVLFGGYTAAGVSDETWEWDGSTWRQPSTCYADCDTSTGIASLDVFDYLCFQNEFAAGAPYACDCETSSGTGVCDVFDFLCFQNRFVNGCR